MSTPPPQPPVQPVEPESDLARCTIYTRRQDASDAFAAGLADRLETVEAWFAAGLIAGFGVEGVNAINVTTRLAQFAARWMETGELVGYRVSDDDGDIVWTSLAPAESWVPVADRIEWGGRRWMVLGAGLATTTTGASLLATHAWIYRLDINDSLHMPTVLIDREAETSAFVAAAFARERGIPVGSVDRAYGILRAIGVPVEWETLLACAAGITWNADREQHEEAGS